MASDQSACSSSLLLLNITTNNNNITNNFVEAARPPFKVPFGQSDVVVSKTNKKMKIKVKKRISESPKEA